MPSSTSPHPSPLPLSPTARTNVFPMFFLCKYAVSRGTQSAPGRRRQLPPHPGPSQLKIGAGRLPARPSELLAGPTATPHTSRSCLPTCPLPLLPASLPHPATCPPHHMPACRSSPGQVPHMPRGSSIVNSTSVTAYQGSKSLLEYRWEGGARLVQVLSVSCWVGVFWGWGAFPPADRCPRARSRTLPLPACAHPANHYTLPPTKLWRQRSRAHRNGGSNTAWWQQHSMVAATQHGGSDPTPPLTLPPCSATKGAIVTFTRSLALQLAPQGIRVNAVAAGPVRPAAASCRPPLHDASCSALVPHCCLLGGCLPACRLAVRISGPPCRCAACHAVVCPRAEPTRLAAGGEQIWTPLQPATMPEEALEGLKASPPPLGHIGQVRSCC